MSENLTKDKSKKERLFVVYMHVNKENGKKYIGITCQKPERRWQNGYGYKTNIYFWRAIEKYGWDGFDHVILFKNLSEDEAKNTEIELIQKYNSKQPNGYNITNGGDNVSEKIHSYETRQKISKALKGRKLSEECKRKISKATSGENNPFYGKKWSKETREKIKKSRIYSKLSEETKLKMSISRKGENSKCAIKVYQYSLKGEFIKEWFSGTIASEKLHINQSNISAACRGERKTAGGFMWRFYKEDKIESLQKTNWKKVVQKDKNGNIVKIFESAHKAANELNLDSSSIIKCCKGKYKTCGGFIFEYLKES